MEFVETFYVFIYHTQFYEWKKKRNACKHLMNLFIWFNSTSFQPHEFNLGQKKNSFSKFSKIIGANFTRLQFVVPRKLALSFPSVSKWFKFIFKVLSTKIFLILLHFFEEKNQTFRKWQKVKTLRPMFQTMDYQWSKVFQLLHKLNTPMIYLPVQKVRKITWNAVRTFGHIKFQLHCWSSWCSVLRIS